MNKVSMTPKLNIKSGGYALPAVVIMSTALIIIGAAVLQNSVAAKQALTNQYYTRVAHEAGQAGLAYAISCIGQDEITWTNANPLKPNSNCAGVAGAGSTDVAKGDKWRSTFNVPQLDVRADGATIATSNGKVELLSNDGSVYRTYTQVVKRVAQVLLEQLASRQIIGQSNASYVSSLTTSDNQIYSAGGNNYGQLGDGTTINRSTPVKFELPGTLTARQMAETSDSSYVLASDYQVYGAGNNGSGQLGNGNTTDQSTPVKFNLPGLLTAVKAIARFGSGYVIASDNQMYGSGQNTVGQLGDGTLINKSTPVKFNLPGSLTAQQASSRYRSAYVLASDNQVYGAGLNGVGQLGNANTTNQSTPVKFILPGSLTARQVVSGFDNTYVIASDNQVYGAGRGVDGELGNGATTNRSTPVKFNLPGSLTAKQVVNDNNTTYVLASDNQVYGAGANANGQLGNGNTTSQSTPVKFNLIAGLTAVKVVTTDNAGYVLASDRQVYGAGFNASGQLGNGNTTDQSTPVKFNLDTGLSVNDVISNASSAHVLISSGQIYAAGDNSKGQLGNGNTIDQSTPVEFVLPTTSLLEKTVQKGSMVTATTHVLASDRQVYGAGLNTSGQLGNGNNTNQNRPVNFLMGIQTANNIASGIATTSALESDSQVYGAGSNAKGQLGDGTTTNRNTPVKFNLPGGLTADTITTGANSTHAIASDNQVYGSGQNVYGQLSNGNTTDQSTPVKFNLPGTLTAKQVVATPNNNTFVLASDNQVYGAGYNAYGQLGNGNATSQSTAVKFNLPAGLTAKAVAANSIITFVLASDNQVYGAGYNLYGQLGNGNTTNQSTPVKFNLPAGLTAKQVVASTTPTNNTLVLASDNQVYGAGYNLYGQLGNGNTTNQSTPVKFNLPGTLTAKSVVTSFAAVFVLASDNQVYGAGYNLYGQLGNGNTTNQSTAVEFNLPGSLTASEIVPTLGNTSTFVIATDNQMYGAGLNTSGQLGNDNTTNQSTPVKFDLPSGGMSSGGIIF